jgi:hypothetical protein
MEKSNEQTPSDRDAETQDESSAFRFPVGRTLFRSAARIHAVPRPRQVVTIRARSVRTHC